MPSSLKVISDFAFYGCSSLQNISFSSSPKLKSIGHSAFKGCLSLKGIEIPSSVTNIGDCCFECCRSIEKITLSSFIPKIGAKTFCDCSSLKEITIPSSVTVIESYSFDGCLSLEKVEIPSTVTSIGSYVFRYCSSLKEINLPSSITKIEDYTFIGCISLSKINIPQTITDIGNKAFEGCLELQNFLHQHFGESYQIKKIEPPSDRTKSSIIECVNINRYKEIKSINRYNYKLKIISDKITQQKIITKVPINSRYKQSIQELKIRLTAINPTIVKFYGLSLNYFNSPYPVLLYEYIEPPTLSEIIHSNFHSLDNTSKQIILIGILHAINLLHELNIFPGDISLSNILIDENKHPQMTGLSYSFFKNGFEKYNTAGTPLYMAPEAFASNSCKESDIYSFGIVMHEIIIGKVPYKKNSMLNKNRFIKAVQFGPIIDPRIKNSLKELINQCCDLDITKRPTFNEIFNHLAYDQEFYLDDVDGEKIKKYADWITLT